MMDVLEQIRTVPIVGDGAATGATRSPPLGGGVGADAATVVVEGILLAQEPDLAEQAADDIRNSMLFAQLAADHVAVRTVAPEQWYEVYASTLATLGWAEAAHDTSHSDKGPPIDWERALLAHFPATARDSAAKAIAAARALPQEAPARQVWSAAVSGSSAINFAVAVAAANDTSPGVVETRAVARTQFDEDGFLDWSAPFAFDTTFDRRSLNEDLYATLRATVKERLGTKIDRYIIAVD